MGFSKPQDVDFAKFDKILFYDFNNDVRDTGSPSDLFDLISQFKTKVGYGTENTTLGTEPQKNNLNVRRGQLNQESSRWRTNFNSHYLQPDLYPHLEALLLQLVSYR